MSVTPESDKTVSMTSNAATAAEGPTPKNEFKKPALQRQYFMSPTDALVSPCTQKLLNARRIPKKLVPSNHRPRYVLSSHHPPSKLANKENEHRSIPEGKAASDDLPAPKQQATPHETNV